MTAIGEALAALKKVVLIEERITSQSRKLEQLALSMVDMEKRLARLEGRMEGFFAAAGAFSGGPQRAFRVIETPESTPLIRQIPDNQNE